MDIRDVKKNLNRRVIYKSRGDSGEYELVGCILRCNRDTRKFFYQAELQDLKNNRSVLICGLNDVEVLKND